MTDEYLGGFCGGHGLLLFRSIAFSVIAQLYKEFAEYSINLNSYNSYCQLDLKKEEAAFPCAGMFSSVNGNRICIRS
jgi:hypothetical protein